MSKKCLELKTQKRQKEIFKKAAASLLILLAAVFVFSKANISHAANLTWDGGGSGATCGGFGTGNNWSCANNWSGDVAPVAGDTVTFDATSTKRCNVDASVSVANFYMNVGYNVGDVGLIIITAGKTLLVTSQLTLADGVLDGADSSSTIEAQGNVTVSSTWDGGNAILKFTGSNDQTFDLTGAEALYDGDVEVNKSAGSVLLNSNFTADAASQDFTVTAGTFDITGRNLSTTDAGGATAIKSGGAFKARGDETILLKGAPFEDGSSIVWNGAAGQTYTLLDIDPDGPNTYNNVNLTILSGTYNMAFNATIGHNLTIASTGVLYTNSFSLTVSGSLSLAGTLAFKGDETTISLAAGMDIANHGKVYYHGTGTYNSLVGGNSYPYLYFDGGGTFKHTGTLNVEDNLTLTSASTLNSNGQDVTLAGDFDVCLTCTYTSGANTFTFDGNSQSINDKDNVVSLSFNNLVKNVTSPLDFIWGAGSTITVAGAATLTGSSRVNYLNLITDNSGQQVNFDPQGVRTIQYARVRDNKNTNAAVIAAGAGSVDLGWNINWEFAGVTMLRQPSGDLSLPWPMEVTEGGATDFFTVVLVTQPTNNMVITITPDTQTTTNPTSLTFTAVNWATPQTVTVTAVDDNVAEGAHTSAIAHSSASLDLIYDGIPISNITANITDNDTAGVTVTQSGGSTAVTEGGATDSYTVVLDTQPTNNVVITITPDAQTTTIPASLTFTAVNWATPQTVTVTAVNDTAVEGNHTSTITQTAASTDGNYNGISISNVTANITDNDGGGGGGVTIPPIPPQITPPSPPTNLTAAEVTATSIKWCFDNNAPSATVFYLYNQSQEEITRLNVLGGQPSGTNVCLNEENLIPNQTLGANSRYVKAFNSQGLSDPAYPVAVVTTLAAVPGAPLLTAIDKDKAKLVLAADQNSTPTEYALWEKTTDQWVNGLGVFGAAPAWLTRAGWGNETGLIINSLTAGATYEFKVKARNAIGQETDFSDSSLIMVLNNPPDLTVTLSARIVPPDTSNPLSATSKTVDIAMLSFLGLFTLLTIRIPRKALFIFSHPHKSFTKIAKRDENGQWLSSYTQFKRRHRLSRLAFWGSLFSAMVKIFIIICFVCLGINPLFAKGATPIQAGDVIELTVKVKNQGAGPATEVKISSEIPAGFVYTGASQPAIVVANALQVDLGIINPNEEKTAQWIGQVAEQAPTLVFIASAQAKELAQAVSSNTVSFSAVSPPEICDGKDNNGDGAIDEDFPEKGKVCALGKGACLSHGVKICQNGAIKCDAAPKLPSQEVCDDKIDNDCDGTTDVQDSDCKIEEPVKEEPVKEEPKTEEQETGEQKTQEQGQNITGSPSAPLPESVEVPVKAESQNLITQVVNQKNIENVLQTINTNVLKNPTVKKANVRYAAPALIAAAAANIGVAIPALNLLAYLQLILQYLQTLIFQPVLLFSRKKRKAWGVAYNSLSKMPVDLATIRLVEAQTNRLLQTKVTDRDGRYVFLVNNVGQVRLEAIKAGHSFPSQYLKTKTTDLDLTDLYHGESLAINKKGDLLTRNIPLDPEEKIIPPELIIKKKRRARLQSSLALTGFGFACVSFAVSPTYFIGVLLGAHIFFYWLFHRLSLGRKPKGFGIVLDSKTQKPLAYAIVRIFENQYNKLLETQITDSKGRYSFLVGRGQYYLTFEKKGYELLKSPMIDKTLPQAPNKEGFVGESVVLRKAG